MNTPPQSQPKQSRTLWTLVILQLVALVVLASAIVRKQPVTDSASGPTLPQVVKTQAVHVGCLGFDPRLIKDPESAKPSGTFIDAIELIAEQLKAKPIYHETNLANFSSGLQSGQYDLSIGPTFRTIPRATSVTFCRPLTYIGNAAVVRK